MTNFPSLDDNNLSCDALYDGALRLWQPKQGFRVNLDTVLLAAAADRLSSNTIELGAGAGGVCLALAQHCPDMAIMAVERDPMMAAMLNRNIIENNLKDRVTLQMADALMQNPSWAKQWHQVLINPPYHDAASTASDNQQKAMAKAARSLQPWLDAARLALTHKGRLVMISRADRVDQILTGLTPHFGEITLRPIFTRPDQSSAKRVLVSARLGMRGGADILPSVVVYADAKTDRMTPQFLAVENGKGQISMASPNRQMASR